MFPNILEYPQGQGPQMGYQNSMIPQAPTGLEPLSQLGLDLGLGNIGQVNPGAQPQGHGILPGIPGLGQIGLNGSPHVTPKVSNPVTEMNNWEKFGQGTQGISSLLQGILGMKQFGLAKEQFSMAKSDRANQVKLTNSELRDRQIRRAGASGAAEDPDSYMKRTGVA